MNAKYKNKLPLCFSPCKKRKKTENCKRKKNRRQFSTPQMNTKTKETIGTIGNCGKIGRRENELKMN